MLNRQVRSFALRAVRKHPRRALKVLLFAGRHRKAIATAVKLIRRSSRLARAVEHTAADLPVTGEVRSALAGFVGRARRGARAGSAEQRAAELAAKQQRTRRRIVRATVITAGAVGGAGYTGWKKTRGSSAAV